MKKFIIILAILLISIPVFAADNAIVKELSGRVEIQKPGGRWQTAAAGDIIPTGASISTGFRSSAVLEVGESVLEVDALTRMKLEELVQSQGIQTTGLFLRVGKVNAEVKRSANLTHDFKLRSPSSTAAVRGTEFKYAGNVLTVENGTVSFFSAALGRDFKISQGQLSRIFKSGKQSGAFGEEFQKIQTVAIVVKEQDNTSQDGDSSNSLNMFGITHGFPTTGSGNITITVAE